LYLPTRKFGNFIHKCHTACKLLVFRNFTLHPVLYLLLRDLAFTLIFECDVRPRPLLAIQGDANYRCIGDVFALQ
jgi:hypothetical protein